MCFEIGGITVSIEMEKIGYLHKNFSEFLSQKRPQHEISYTDMEINPEDIKNIFYDEPFQTYICKTNKNEELITTSLDKKPLNYILFQNSNHAVHNFSFNMESGKSITPPPTKILPILLYFLKNRSMFLHAVSGIFQNNGFVFCGKSEAGKSTIAQKWNKYENIEILCDERIIISKEENNTLNVYGSPWPGSYEYVSSKNAPLKYLFCLSPNVEGVKKITKPNEFIRHILPLTYHRPWDKEYTVFLLSMLNKIYSEIPTFFVNRTIVSDPDSFFKKLPL